jgi:DNA-binding protein YbaB
MKKTLNNILKERTETIEYRAICKQLMNVAQNGGSQLLRIQIDPNTVTMLQNELLTVEKIKEHGYEK